MFAKDGLRERLERIARDETRVNIYEKESIERGKHCVQCAWSTLIENLRSLLMIYLIKRAITVLN